MPVAPGSACMFVSYCKPRLLRPLGAMKPRGVETVTSELANQFAPRPSNRRHGWCAAGSHLRGLTERRCASWRSSELSALLHRWHPAVVEDNRSVRVPLRPHFAVRHSNCDPRYRAPIPNVAHWNVPQVRRCGPSSAYIILQPDDERFPQAIEVHFPSQVAKPSEVLNVLKGLIAQKPKTNGTQMYARSQR